MEKTINRKSLVEINFMDSIKKCLTIHKYGYVTIMLVAFLMIFLMFFISRPSAKSTLLNYKVFAGDQKMEQEAQPLEETSSDLYQRQSSYAYEGAENVKSEEINSIQVSQKEATNKVEEGSKSKQVMELSEKDLDALYRIVEAEATDEDMEGRILIANVIFNRVASDGFPNSVYEVIHQKIGGRAQFSPIDDKRYFKVEVSGKTKKAVTRALQGEDYSKGALFFVARSMASRKAVSWFDRNLTKVYEHGVHEFFTY